MTSAANERSNVGKRERSHLRLRLRIRHMDVPAAAGGELRVKTTLFARSSRREWQEARVADPICHHRSDTPCEIGCRLNCLATPATNERSNVGKRERSHLRLRLRIRHMDVPAAAGGELRVKTTLSIEASGASGRTPESPIQYAITGATAVRSEAGAGDGNRTHVSSLGSYSSTIELHPRPDGFYAGHVAHGKDGADRRGLQ